MSATPSPPHVSALTPAQAGNATLLFASSFLFNLMLRVVAFYLFGGRELLSRRVTPGGDESTRRFERDVKKRQEKSPASGALTVANTPEAHREFVFKRLMRGA